MSEVVAFRSTGEVTTDEMLDRLALVGRPSVRRMKDGTWYANLEVPAPEGCTVEISSDFKHPTHRSALVQLCARLGATRSVLTAEPA